MFLTNKKSRVASDGFEPPLLPSKGRVLPLDDKAIK